jgi:hypothetical protein
MEFGFCGKMRTAAIMMVFTGICLLVSGCAGTGIMGSSGSSSLPAAPVKDKNAPQYYDFTDILIPGELKMDDKSTFVVKTAGFATGILVLEGRINRNELFSFFQTNMTKDNWEAISSFKSPRTSTFLLFKKAQRWCIISIRAGDFNTHVEIGVAPASEGESSGLYK